MSLKFTPLVFKKDLIKFKEQTFKALNTKVSALLDQKKKEVAKNFFKESSSTCSKPARIFSADQGQSEEDKFNDAICSSLSA